MMTDDSLGRSRLPMFTPRLVDVIATELDEHGYEDDDEKRWQVAYHLAQIVVAVLNEGKKWTED